MKKLLNIDYVTSQHDMNRKNSNRSIRNFIPAFTLIEIITVIVVIGILASISVVSYGSWRKNTVNTVVKSDLTNAIAALEGYRNFNNKYPSDITSLSSFKTSDGVDVAGGSSDNGDTYCINAVSTTYDSIKYYISSSSGNIIKEGSCGSIPSPSPNPIATVGVDGLNIQAVIEPVACTTGTPQYSVRSRINDGLWTSYGAWSTVLTYTQPSKSGTRFGYQAQSRCYSSESHISSIVAGPEATYQTSYTNVPLPSKPIIAIVLNGSKVQAAVIPVTCAVGMPQYSIRSMMTPSNAWSNFGTWSDSSTDNSRVAVDDVKYTYQAKSRCYVDALNFSEANVGDNSTYIDPINAPSSPNVNVNTIADTTTWSWSAATCDTGVANYSYDHTITPGSYDSGWINNGTVKTKSFTTSTEDQTYKVAVRANCVGVYTTSDWSVSGSAEYYHPPTVLAPTNLTAAVGSSTLINVSWSASTYATSYTLQRDTSSSFSSPVTLVSQAGLTFVSNGLSQGVRYYYRVNATGPGGTSVWSGTVNATTIIDSPAAPVVTASVVDSGNTRFSWPAVTCVSGTSARYQYRYTIDYSGGYTSSMYSTSSLFSVLGTVNEGYQYSDQVQAQCYTSATSSPWSVVGSASYIRPVTTPGAPTNFTSSLSSDRLLFVQSWTAPACGPGAYAHFQYNSYATSFTWVATGQSGWLGWQGPGYWASTHNIPSNAGPMAYGMQVQDSVQYMCKNLTTSRMSGFGPVGTSPMWSL